ncbi:MAG: CDP-alcohol phosphatidyltransferase family protein [Candidatus Omnitrophica bacterium]|nr:CDP-alcohol phosphatidyltransferase family protein [Candidatus Omnitrophota bacterium]
MNWPNRLTICRIVLVPVFILSVIYCKLHIAFFVFLLAAATDALDGYFARAYNQKTKLGAILDPIADKLLVGSAFICFSLVDTLPGHIKIPVYVPIIVISRDVLILIGAATIYLLAGEIKVHPTAVGKITTFFQMTTVIALLLGFVHSNWLWNTTVILTILSGLDYIRVGSKQVNDKL